MTLLALEGFLAVSLKFVSQQQLIFLTILSFIGLILSQMYRLQKKLQGIGLEFAETNSVPRFKNEIRHLENEADRFKRDLRLILKSQMRVSILFWTHYYKKEKMMPYHEAKKEIFKNMKKEFSQVYWMVDLISEIKREIDDFDRSKSKVDV